MTSPQLRPFEGGASQAPRLCQCVLGADGNCRGDPMKSSMGKSHEFQWDYLMLVGGFKHFLFSILYMGCHPSHWRTHIFQDGYCTTNQNGLVMSCKSHWKWENLIYLLRKISNGLVFPGRFTGFLPEYFMGKSWKIHGFRWRFSLAIHWSNNSGIDFAMAIAPGPRGPRGPRWTTFWHRGSGDAVQPYQSADQCRGGAMSGGWSYCFFSCPLFAGFAHGGWCGWPPSYGQKKQFSLPRIQLAVTGWCLPVFHLFQSSPALGLSLNWFGLQGQRLVLMSSSEQYPLTRHVHFWAFESMT